MATINAKYTTHQNTQTSNCNLAEIPQLAISHFMHTNFQILQNTLTKFINSKGMLWNVYQWSPTLTHIYTCCYIAIKPRARQIPTPLSPIPNKSFWYDSFLLQILGTFPTISNSIVPSFSLHFFWKRHAHPSIPDQSSPFLEVDISSSWFKWSNLSHPFHNTTLLS